MEDMRLCCVHRADLILLGHFLTKQVPEQHVSAGSYCVYSEEIVYSELNKVPPLGSLFFSASHNGISMDGVVMLAGALCSSNTLTQIHIR